MAIDTKTECTITCDHCGATIGEGEQWFQVATNVASGIFDGRPELTDSVSVTAVQLCAKDYAASEPSIAVLTPAPSPVPLPPTSLPPV